IGDIVSISGYIFESEDIKGFIGTKIICDDSEFPLQLVPIEIKANEKINFPEDIKLPQITISASMSGLCQVKLSFLEGAMDIDSATSNQFNIVRLLDGTFSIDDSKIQVGSTLTLSGKITQLDGGLVSGFAEIYFNHDDKKYLIDVIDVREGEISYTYKATATPPGNYQIDVLVRDTYGNEMAFENIATFMLINKLSVTAELDKNEYQPGETIKVTGTAKDAHMEDIIDATAEVSLDFRDFTTKVKDGMFKYDLAVPSDIKAGKHTVFVMVKDDEDNTGGEQISIKVQAIPTKIQNDLSSMSVFPKEDFPLTVSILDQANDKMYSDVLIEILDPKGNLRVSKSITSNIKVTFMVPEFAMPGEWKIKSSKGKLADEDMFTVKENEEMLVDINEESIRVTNAGNIKFKDKIEILFEGGENYKAKVNGHILPEGSLDINLGDYAPDGMYDVSVILPNQAPIIFEDIAIMDGKPVKMFNWLYIIFIILFALFILFFLLSKPSKPKQTIPKSKKRKLAVIRRENEDFQVMENEKKKNIKDFKDRVIEEINKTEKRTHDTLRSKRGGLFGGASSSSEDGNVSGFSSMFG
ncbi:MAG: hypothetical protein V1906_02835, partial [Candidatus Woesearchaeota archaeon]